VVDDCSTDDSTKVIRRFIARSKGIRLICHDENLGYSAAKNTGILEANGEYIRLIDADDRLTPTAIEVAMDEFLKEPKLGLVHGIALRWYGGTDLRGHNPKTYVHAQGRLYHRKVYQRFGLYHEGLRSMADKEFVYRIGVHPDSPLPKAIKEKRIKSVVAWYRKHDTQMHRTRKKHPKYNDRLKKAFNRRIRQLQKEGITKDNTRFP
jgi:glycosyltransferase involved in cell wall biosynthesis